MITLTPSRIRHLRMRLRLSQPQLARQIGVAQQTLADWEKRGLPKQVAPMQRLLGMINDRNQ